MKGYFLPSKLTEEVPLYWGLALRIAVLRAKSLRTGKPGSSLASDAYYLVLESDFTDLSACLPLTGRERHLPRNEHHWRECSDPQGIQLKLVNVHYHPLQS